MANDAKILELLELQSKLLQAFTEGNKKPKETNKSRPEQLMDSLANNLSEFCYDPANGITFEGWFSRHEDIFCVDGKDLHEASKVRLLMRKLNPTAQEKYASYILPKNTRDIDFKETTDILRSLHSSAEADIRTKLLSSLEDDGNLDLTKLLSGVQKYINLKKDTALIQNASTPVTSVNAVLIFAKLSINGTIRAVHFAVESFILQTITGALQSISFKSDMRSCSKKIHQYAQKQKAKRPVAYSVLPLIEDELQQLQDRNVISPVDYSDWAAPIVVVKRASGGVRICGDYSSGLNQSLESHQYPLPLPEDIFSKIANSPYYTHIDLADAYLQVSVTLQSRKLLTINTHKRLFTFNRLAPGVKSAPGAFQQLMDAILAGVDGVAAYLDDIVVSGKDWDDHMLKLNTVLQRLLDYNFRIKIVDANGIRPDPEKISRISTMPAPTNITELSSFLGAVNYYGKFSILASDLMLTHYNPALPIKVAADASNVGMGACIIHIFPNGDEKVISHAARSLTSAETSYSQIEKEAAALIFAVKKFHRMIFRRKFLLLTNHKPLRAILSQISPYYARGEGLAVIDGCIMLKDRIIIPTCFQKRILLQLHRGYPGIAK
ncbi:uncharacterized protein K02A2.6-like [Eupeodes corollae]|uniref:uncharacterized protein K02A2.6-like n=1 Tax=Eupeodes corollae TaxID=290404 RepID=UPI002490A4BF|nr:uncharacterized protein K02A2.6-like [Eupeodes corollae]